MAASLCYTTRQDVAFDTRAAIHAERLLQTWNPWCGPIGFIDEGQGPMVGCTELCTMLSRHAHGDRERERHHALITRHTYGYDQ